jgi:hypothetical protein
MCANGGAPQMSNNLPVTCTLSNAFVCAAPTYACMPTTAGSFACCTQTGTGGGETIAVVCAHTVRMHLCRSMRARSDLRQWPVFESCTGRSGLYGSRTVFGRCIMRWRHVYMCTGHAECEWRVSAATGHNDRYSTRAHTYQLMSKCSVDWPTMHCRNDYMFGRIAVFVRRVSVPTRHDECKWRVLNTKYTNW